VRLVADESCDFSIVIGVRSAGHDVVSITETMSGVDDEKVIELARSERRLLLTEDKDFGQLVFAATKENSGVILIRYPTFARSTLTAAVRLTITKKVGVRSPRSSNDGYVRSKSPFSASCS
jgi:predicted nuclease of predicted toxin-antitoxin system